MLSRPVPTLGSQKKNNMEILLEAAGKGEKTKLSSFHIGLPERLMIFEMKEKIRTAGEPHDAQTHSQCAILSASMSSSNA